MKKKLLVLSLIISSTFTLPSFAEEQQNTDVTTGMDQALLYNQLMGQMQGTSAKDLEKVTSDPEMASLMEVLKMVQGKKYKDAVPVLEKLLTGSKAKSLTPQTKEMIKNLIEVLKVLETENFQ